MKQMKLIVPVLLAGIGLAAGPVAAKDGPQNRGNGNGHGHAKQGMVDHARHDDRNRQYHAQSGKWDNGRRGPPSWAKGKDYRSYAYDRVIVVPADLGPYRIVNLGQGPVTVHKTCLKDDFETCAK